VVRYPFLHAVFDKQLSPVRFRDILVEVCTGPQIGPFQQKFGCTGGTGDERCQKALLLSGNADFPRHPPRCLRPRADDGEKLCALVELSANVIGQIRPTFCQLRIDDVQVEA
jgi:hypothetical protein